jgi:hypothetical protein
MREMAMVLARSAEALGDAVAGAERLLRRRAPGGRVQTFVDRAGRVALVRVEAAGIPWPVELHRGEREAFGYTGFVNADDAAPAAVRGLIEISDGWLGRTRVRMRQSPGGMAGYFLADGRRSRCLAWSSLAGVEGVFYTIGPRVSVVASSPLVAHLVGLERGAPSFSSQWARRVLAGDYTLWEDTPYQDTWYAPPRTTLLVDDRGAQFLPHPIDLDERRFRRREPAAVEALVQEGLRAMDVARRLPRPELQLSGGKDSRLAAALAVRAGVEVDCVTFAPPDAGESAAAGRIAEFLNLPHRCVELAIAPGEQLRATLLANLRRADGLINENRQLAFPAAEPQPGRLLMQGQAHHARGGFHVASNAKAIRPRLHGTLLGDVGMVAAELVTERSGRVDAILDGYQVSYPADLAYWAYADWRMARWLQPTVLATTRTRPLLWPMMDERVLMTTARLSMPDRTSEYTFYAALEALAPGIGRIPLHDGVWKFDRGGPPDSPFPEDFAERNARPAEPQPRGGRPTPEKRLTTVQPLLRAVLGDSPHGAELRSWIRPEALRALLESGDELAALGLDHARAVRFAWKVVAIALVLEGGWLDA